MTRYFPWPVLPVLVLCLASRSAAAEDPATRERVATTERLPNIVYIMSDELPYYELSHMGNPKIRTPRIDRMAAEGLRFTQALAGSPVCAPLRCTLMTGKHAGHASVRANDGGTPLRAEEPTIATMLKQHGYATGGFGKWGCGGRDSTGVPERHGFDVFFGYYDQVHAHSFYPPYLVRNSEEVPLEGNAGGRGGETYSHYQIMEEALRFIREHQDQPFFCYLPITPPHGMYDIPADDPAWQAYRDDEWMRDPNVPRDAKNYAAMVTMVDRNVGEVLDLLKQLGLEGNTIVFFTGDNGGQDRFRGKEFPRGFFGPNVDPRTGVEFRGGKGNLYEGGLRIPFLVRWPGRIAAGRVSDLVFYQPDVFPTLAELLWQAGATRNASGGDTADGKRKSFQSLLPGDVDGMSVLPEILGAEAVGREQPKHSYLYWEFGGQTAVREGDWKAIQPKPEGDWELYDLSEDVSETRDISAEHPERLARLRQYAQDAHEPVRPGKYLDAARTRHERDRWAKWGTSRNSSRTTGREVHRIADAGRIPAEAIDLLRFSSENRPNQRLARFAVDGDPHTVWHSQFSGELAEPPHELLLDLGESRDVQGFRYLARQDTSWNGSFGETEFYVSDSPDEWGRPVATCTFQKVRKPQAVDCREPVRGRYVRVRVLGEVNGKPWASAADLAVIAASMPTANSSDRGQ